jgi:hypothetical protein
MFPNAAALGLSFYIGDHRDVSSGSYSPAHQDTDKNFWLKSLQAALNVLFLYRQISVRDVLALPRVVAAIRKGDEFDN